MDNFAVRIYGQFHSKLISDQETNLDANIKILVRVRAFIVRLPSKELCLTSFDI